MICDWLVLYDIRLACIVCVCMYICGQPVNLSHCAVTNSLTTVTFLGLKINHGNFGK